MTGKEEKWSVIASTGLEKQMSYYRSLKYIPYRKIILLKKTFSCVLAVKVNICGKDQYAKLC